MALFAPELRRTTIVTTLIFGASYGIAFGAIQQLPQILGAQRIGTPVEAGHVAVRAIAKEKGSAAMAAAKAAKQPEPLAQRAMRQAAGNASDEVVAGVFTVAQFSFWGNCIPLVFPVHLRGTGESFAANIGGRVLGTAAAWITITLSASDKPDPARVAIVSACVAGGYALVGVLLTQMLPEPKPEGLKE